MYLSGMKSEGMEREINWNYLILVSIITAALLLLLFIPRELLFLKSSYCLHYRLLGVQCPLCGMTRGTYSFIHLYFSSAWKYNFNVFLLALIYPVFISRIFNSSPWLKKIEKGLLLLLGAGFLLLYILRLAGLLN